LSCLDGCIAIARECENASFRIEDEALPATRQGRLGWLRRLRAVPRAGRSSTRYGRTAGPGRAGPAMSWEAEGLKDLLVTLGCASEPALYMGVLVLRVAWSCLLYACVKGAVLSLLYNPEWQDNASAEYRASEGASEGRPCKSVQYRKETHREKRNQGCPKIGAEAKPNDRCNLVCTTSLAPRS
jgi:hypothetical protein